MTSEAERLDAAAATIFLLILGWVRKLPPELRHQALAATAAGLHRFEPENEGVLRGQTPERLPIWG